MRGLAFLFLLIIFSGSALAQPGNALSIDLAEKSIDISTGFNGAKLVIYGTKTQPGDMAITVRGPTETMMVRRKEQILGIWMNRKSLRFEEVPSYYDLALSGKESDIAPSDILLRYDIGLDALQFETRENVDTAVVDTFREALIRNKQGQGLFPLEPKPIKFINNDFFRASFYLPANVPTGLYRVKAYLFRDGQVVDTQEREIKVAQTGFSAEIFLFSRTQSLAYGLIAVLMALFFGWGAYVVLRRE